MLNPNRDAPGPIVESFIRVAWDPPLIAMSMLARHFDHRMIGPFYNDVRAVLAAATLLLLLFIIYAADVTSLLKGVLPLPLVLPPSRSAFLFCILIRGRPCHIFFLSLCLG